MPPRIGMPPISYLARIATLLRLGLGAVSLCLAVASVTAPALQTARGYPAGEPIYRRLSRICHQYPSRCLWLTGRPTALCTRCTAAYAAIVVAAIVIPMTRPRRRQRWVGVALVMLAAADPLRQWLGGGESNSALRLILGAAGGIGICLAIFPHNSRQPRSN